MKRTLLASTLFLLIGGGLATAGGDTSSTPKPAPQASSQPAAETPADLPNVDLLFDTDSSQLPSDARADLKPLAKWAKCSNNGALVLEGHADQRGTQQHNVVLSAERAGAVREKLIAMGVPSDHIIITVYGKNGPSRGSLAQDRRVTIRATDRPVQAQDIAAMR